MSPRIIGVIALLVLVVGVLVLGPAACNKYRSMGAQSRLDRAQSGALVNSASDAVETAGNRAATEEAGRAAVEEAKNDINKQTDAGGVTDAGRRGLCGLASHRGKPECVQHPASK